MVLVAVVVVIVMAVRNCDSIVSPFESVEATPSGTGIVERPSVGGSAEVTSEDLIMDMIGVDTLPESSVQPVIPES